MTTTQLIKKVGEKNIKIQSLNPCITNISSTKQKTTKVTFLTNEITATDVFCNEEKIGIIMWIPKDKWPKELL